MLNRAQTETLGFVLVFALITASIGLVYASGFTGLNEAREFEQVNNAERAFEVFADNIGDIVQWNAPSRSTEIRLADASLTIAEPISVRVNASGVNESYEIRPIIYDANTGERVIFVQGAIIREAGDDAVMVRESTMLITENRTVLPIIQTRLNGRGSVAGSVTVLIRASHSHTSIVLADESPPVPVWFNITTPRTKLWIEHMESKSGITDCLEVDDTAACRIETDRIHITRVQIDTEIE